MEDVGKSEPNSETAIAAVDPIKPKPDEDSQNEIQGESSSLPASNESNARKVPESLPFLNDQLVADFIAEQEQIAGDANDASNWSKEEEMNFFRGLYVHGWGEWTNISKMVQTRDKPGCKSHALSLEKKFPELRKYFSANQVNKMQQKQGVKIKRYGVGSSGRARRSSSSRVNSKSKTSTALRQKAKHSGPSGQPGPQLLRSDSKKVDSHSEGKKKSRSSHGNERATKPRGVISLGNFLISTDSCRPSSLIVDADESRSDDARAPDYANHSVRPPMPSNDSQIYIPGSRVYARWMNRDDPVSYGAWYPGSIHASKMAPIQEEDHPSGIPNLLYHVKFDDGAESIDLDVQDILLQYQYEKWLKDLNEYHSMPQQTGPRKQLSKKTRVYAKWIDPTDPDLHGSWMPGEVSKSLTRDDKGKSDVSYHISFDNGDSDTSIPSRNIIEESVYNELLQEKTREREQRKKISRRCGFDLISEASKIASPIRPLHERAQH